MGETESGLTNAQYATWLNNTASQDCNDVEEIYLKFSNGNDDMLDSSEICNWMEAANETLVATLDEVRFSGVDGEENPWEAVDERLTVNLERTENFANVPVKIRRPTGS